MPPFRRFPSGFVVVILGVFFAVSNAASPAQSESSTAPASVCVWVRPSEYEDASHTQASFVLEEIVPVTEAMLIPCEARLDASLEQPRLMLRVFDGEGGVSFEGRAELDGGTGTFSRSFLWPVEGVPDGVYRARLEVLHAFNQPLAWREVQLEKRTYEVVWRSVVQLRSDLAALEDSIRSARASDVPAYASLRAVVASDALLRAEELLSEGKWPQAAAYAQFARSSCDSARALITFEALIPELRTPFAKASAVSPEIRDGAFYSSTSREPVFMFGLREPAMHSQSTALFERYGLNFAVIEISPAELLLEEGINRDALSRLDTFLANADALNIGVTVELATDTAPAWLDAPAYRAGEVPREGKRPRVADHRQARTLGQRQLKAAAPVLKRHPSVNGVSLAFEPGFHWETEEVRKGFEQAIARKYQNDRRAVNRVWRTRMRSLDEIEILWDYDRPSYQYEWQAFHQHVVSTHFNWLAGHAERVFGDLPRQITLPGTAFQPGEARTGINRETLSGMTDVTACSAAYAFGDTPYVVPFPHPEIAFRLLRSLAPAHPLVVSSMTLNLSAIPVGSEVSRCVHTALWEAAIAGVNGCAVNPAVFGENPGGLDGFTTAYLDLNRLGGIVTAFQRTDAPIAILWSMPSKIYRDGETFMNSVQRVYEGCAFFGFPVRFITESECAAGGLERVAVLAVPEVPALADETFLAIDAYAKAGGTVIRSGRPAPYTPDGSSRHDVIAQTARTIFVRASDTPTVYLHSLDAAYVFGVLPPIPRTINNYGYPLEGVKSRYTELDGQGYLYVVNLRHEPVRAHLFGGPREGRDLVRGRDVRFPMDLDPLDPMVIRLDPPEPAAVNEGDVPKLAAGEADPVVLVPSTP